MNKRTGADENVAFKLMAFIKMHKQRLGEILIFFHLITLSFFDLMTKKIDTNDRLRVDYKLNY
ncbi:hypothetical protein J7E63_07660 [Bacillus sp. ISL-75]|nr:hypothetical protein [Bacillus sp. ISL-75]